MAIFTCPGCGRPTTIALATPNQFRCRTCGAVGTTPPELAARLAEAGRWLCAYDLRHHDSARIHRAQVESLRRALTTYRLVAAVPLVLLGLVAAFSVWFALDHETTDSSFIAFGVPPFVAYVTLMLVSSRRLVRRRRALEAQHAAIPPIAGHAPECRLCGAVLPQATGEPYVDCDYCGVDNLVAPEVLRAIGRDRLLSIEEYERSVADAARAASSQITVTTGASLVSAVVLPIFAFGVMFAVMVVLAIAIGSQHAPDKDLALLPVGSERCLANTTKHAGARLYVYAGKLPDGVEHNAILPAGEVTITREAAIAGKTVIWHGCSSGDRTAVVERVEDFFGSTSIVVRVDGKTESWHPSKGCGLCLPR